MTKHTDNAEAVKDRAFALLVLLHALLVFAALFIFSQSLPDREASKEISVGVTSKIAPFLELFLGSGNVSDHLVRKAAHFAEFFVFGTLSAVCAALRAKYASAKLGEAVAVKTQSFANAAFLSLTTALTDETIQLFTGRGSQVADVWLDFSGAVCAVFAFVRAKKQ